MTPRQLDVLIAYHRYFNDPEHNSNPVNNEKDNHLMKNRESLKALTGILPKKAIKGTIK